MTAITDSPRGYYPLRGAHLDKLRSSAAVLNTKKNKHAMLFLGTRLIAIALRIATHIIAVLNDDLPVVRDTDGIKTFSLGDPRVW